MIEALSLILSALTAVTPANDSHVIEATDLTRTDDARGQRQSETTEERIARMRARLGSRGARVSKVRCGGATCHKGCDAQGGEITESEPVRSDSTNSGYRRVNADGRPCATGVSQGAGYHTAEVSYSP